MLQSDLTAQGRIRTTRKFETSNQQPNVAEYFYREEPINSAKSTFRGKKIEIQEKPKPTKRLTLQEYQEIQMTSNKNFIKDKLN